MPYNGNTPESLVSRSDSKNPATTCRGLTANGSPCRRGLAASPSPGSSPPRKAASRQNIQTNTEMTAFYCWQHKDQAESSSHQPTFDGATQEHKTPQRQSSIDTLMGRLGVMDINHAGNSAYPGKQSDPKNKKKQTKRTFCCFTIIEDDEPVPSRPTPAPKPRPALPSQSQNHNQPMAQVSPAQHPRPPPRKPHHNNNQSHAPTTSNTLLQWIPKSLTPATTSLLLAELAKPISAADEPGYIYMFWVTPTDATKSAPPLDIASSLLPVPVPVTTPSITGTRDISLETDSDESPEQIQRSNTAIRKARDMNVLSSSRSPGGSPETVRLKIGRTSNVHRRLNEWTRQCSNHITLIRYYPYTSSSERRQGQGQVLEPGRKVPHIHRVERLIHIELADIRMRDLGACPECGKEHREWFEVSAERAALKRVDECIRRWVRWAHTH
ncbi:meiotically up-regulated gene 113-domain-containing protein [Aspergillus californicus]